MTDRTRDELGRFAEEPPSFNDQIRAAAGVQPRASTPKPDTSPNAAANDAIRWAAGIPIPVPQDSEEAPAKGQAAEATGTDPGGVFDGGQGGTAGVAQQPKRRKDLNELIRDAYWAQTYGRDQS